MLTKTIWVEKIPAGCIWEVQGALSSEIHSSSHGSRDGAQHLSLSRDLRIVSLLLEVNKSSKIVYVGFKILAQGLLQSLQMLPFVICNMLWKCWSQFLELIW